MYFKNYLFFFQEYEQQMKAYGMPVQSYVWKQPVTTNTGGHSSLIGAFVKAEAANNLIRAAAASTSSGSSSVTAITNSRSATTIGKNENLK